MRRSAKPLQRNNSDLRVEDFADTLQAHVDQVAAYARDLSSYQAASHNRSVIPVLVKTLARVRNVQNGFASPRMRIGIQLAQPLVRFEIGPEFRQVHAASGPQRFQMRRRLSTAPGIPKTPRGSEARP